MRGAGQGSLSAERMLLKEVSQIGSSCILPWSPEGTSLLLVSKALFVEVKAKARQLRCTPNQDRESPVQSPS